VTTYHGIYAYNYKWNFTGPNTEWTGSYAPQVTSSTSHEAGFTINPGSKIWIGATVTDKSGNESLISNSFWSWTKANAPSITVADNKENVWAQKKTVQITGIANHNIRYTTNGVNPTATTGTLLTGTGTKTFIVNENNKVIKAVYINTVTGEVNSAVGSKTITKIDTTLPTVELTLDKDKTTSSEINVIVRGSDTGSGVHMYVYQIKESNASEFRTVGSLSSSGDTPLSGEYTYKFTKLTSNITYNIRVIVYDFALNTTTSKDITVKTLNPAPIITVENPDTWGNYKKITVKKAQGTDPNAKLGVWFVGPCGCRFEWQEIGNTVYVGYGNDPFKCNKHSSKALYTNLNWDGETFSVELRIGNATVWANTRYDMQKVHGTESRIENLKIDIEPPTVSCYMSQYSGNIYGLKYEVNLSDEEPSSGFGDCSIDLLGKDGSENWTSMWDTYYHHGEFDYGYNTRTLCFI